MDDDDAVAPTVGADNAETTWVPPASESASDLAWSLGDDADTVVTDHHPWDSAWSRAVLVVGGAMALALLIGIGGLIMTVTPRDGRVLAAQPATVIVQTSVLELPAPPPVTKTVTVQASPTATVQAAPTTATVTVPATSTGPTRSSKSPTPSSVDSANDQRFLDTVRALGYTIANPQAALRNAHETCRLFQLGESADQVNQQLRAKTGAPMNDVVQFTSSVMLSYPDCVRHTTPSFSGND
ncbi:MAG: DUF732 domain-containing protein [Mycobacterium sp.]